MKQDLAEVRRGTSRHRGALLLAVAFWFGSLGLAYHAGEIVGSAPANLFCLQRGQTLALTTDCTQSRGTWHVFLGPDPITGLVDRPNDLTAVFTPQQTGDYRIQWRALVNPCETEEPVLRVSVADPTPVALETITIPDTGFGYQFKAVLPEVVLHSDAIDGRRLIAINRNDQQSQVLAHFRELNQRERTVQNGSRVLWAFNNQIISTDGTPAGTLHLGADEFTALNQLIRVKDGFAFIAHTVAGAAVPMFTRGTPASTVPLVDVAAYPRIDQPEYAGLDIVASQDGGAFFFLARFDGNLDMWHSDGSGAPATLIESLPTAGQTIERLSFFRFQPHLLFRVETTSATTTFLKEGLQGTLHTIDQNLGTFQGVMDDDAVFGPGSQRALRRIDRTGHLETDYQSDIGSTITDLSGYHRGYWAFDIHTKLTLFPAVDPALFATVHAYWATGADGMVFEHIAHDRLLLNLFGPGPVETVPEVPERLSYLPLEFPRRPTLYFATTNDLAGTTTLWRTRGRRASTDALFTWQEAVNIQWVRPRNHGLLVCVADAAAAQTLWALDGACHQQLATGPDRTFPVVIQGEDTTAVIAYHRTDTPQVLLINDAAPAELEDPALAAALLAQADSDQDGHISDAEAPAVTRLDLAGLGLTSLAGIERFVNLTTLIASHNLIADLSPLYRHQNFGSAPDHFADLGYNPLHPNGCADLQRLTDRFPSNNLVLSPILETTPSTVDHWPTVNLLHLLNPQFRPRTTPLCAAPAGRHLTY